MDVMEVLLSPICGAIGLGIAILYHLMRTRQLRRNLAIQYNMLQNGPTGLVFVQNDRVLMNKTFCLMLGIKYVSRWAAFLDLFSVDIQTLLTEKCAQLKEDKIPFTETIHHQKRIFVVHGQASQKKAFILWWSDITQSRKKVMKEEKKNTLLLEQKNLLEKAWETLPFPAFVRLGDKSLFANQAVGNDAKTLNALHWMSLPFKLKDATYTLTYGQETHTEEELQSMVREVASAHQRLCQELPCAVCLFSANGQLMACSKAFTKLWQLDEKWVKKKPSYEDFWDAVQEKGLMNRVMDFAQYKKQQRGQFASLSETQEIFLYLPNGKIIRRMMIPFASGSVILLDEDKTV